eukprot:MONOS_14766.1-p1 / transcript=MONOS_14766.1 / gene=MONOS_14766 / organism=Monocercomonoides_exilis_PA203 / gene_product=unspecified product / transcript_product=unspecified product / location=Mono_scaffold01068:2952-4821(-) / protein_length=427 / sequence_SO=supercontig / SO=protein_coding / is_pseudo=false
MCTLPSSNIKAEYVLSEVHRDIAPIAFQKHESKGFDILSTEINIKIPLREHQDGENLLVDEDGVELGCGVGIPSLFLSSFCNRVYATEVVEECLPIIVENVRHNSGKPFVKKDHIFVKELDWNKGINLCEHPEGDINSLNWNQNDVDYLHNNPVLYVACDVVYDNALTDQLFQFLNSSMKVNTDILVLSLEKRICFDFASLSATDPAFNYFREHFVDVGGILCEKEGNAEGKQKKQKDFNDSEKEEKTGTREAAEDDLSDSSGEERELKSAKSIEEHESSESFKRGKEKKLIENTGCDEGIDELLKVIPFCGFQLDCEVNLSSLEQYHIVIPPLLEKLICLKIDSEPAAKERWQTPISTSLQDEIFVFGEKGQRLSHTENCSKSKNISKFTSDQEKQISPFFPLENRISELDGIDSMSVWVLWKHG